MTTPTTPIVLTTLGLLAVLGAAGGFAAALRAPVLPVRGRGPRLPGGAALCLLLPAIVLALVGAARRAARPLAAPPATQASARADGRPDAVRRAVRSAVDRAPVAAVREEATPAASATSDW